jgi:hypothetical protein
MKARIPALVLAALLIGCVHNNTQTLVIMQDNVPDTSGGVCLIPGTISSTFRESGLLDRSFFLSGDIPSSAVGYEMYPVVKNNLSSSVSGTGVGIDPLAFNIQLSRADVELSDGASGEPLVTPFSVPLFKVVASGESTGLVVGVIPAALVPDLHDGQIVLAHLTVVGSRDGSEIRSNTVEFPITVCDGCLVNDVGPCTAFTGTASVNVCNIAQDEMAVCCEHSTLGLICPAVAEAASAD